MKSGSIFKIIAMSLIFTFLLSNIAYCIQAPPSSIGQKGSDDGSFNCPKGVAIDSNGCIYVLDDLNCRVQKFSPNGTFLMKWGSQGSGPGQFSGQASNLEGIAIDGEDKIYITDGNHRVQIFDTNGNFINEWDYYGFGTGKFQSTVGIAVDKSNNVFVADYAGSKILKFSKDGTFIKEWGASGDGDGQLWGAWGLATDKNGNVFVTEYWNYRVSEFTNDGTFIRNWGSQGSGNGQFSHPEGIVTDAQGNVYVADNGNNNVQEFSPNGDFIKKWDNTLNDYGFNELAGLALDQNGNVYVANYKGYNVAIIYAATPPLPPTIPPMPPTVQPQQVTVQPQQATTQPQQVTVRPQPTTNGGIIGLFMDNPLYLYGCLGTEIVLFIFVICAYFFYIFYRREIKPGDQAPERPVKNEPVHSEVDDRYRRR